MQIKIKNKIHTREGTSTVQDILKQLGFDPLSTVVTRNGLVVTEDQRIGGEDTIEIIDAISGGL